MNDTLYIIGNGFDLNHGLRTSYINFYQDYINSKAQRIKIDLEILYGTEIHKDIWWSQFEQQLGQVNFEHLAQSSKRQIVPILKSNIRDLLDTNLPLFFGEWINRINQKMSSLKLNKRTDVKQDAYFFTFNYTTLLEDLYKIPLDNIVHIHNSIKDFNKGEPIIVGHRTSWKKLEEFSEKYKSMGIEASYINDVNIEISQHKKNTDKQLEIYSEKIAQYTGIKHFIIMGFSLNDIDMPYIEKIIEVNHDIDAADWTFYYYKEEEKSAFMESLLKLGIKQENINKPIPW